MASTTVIRISFKLIKIWVRKCTAIRPHPQGKESALVFSTTYAG
jgi:hypothetical protein